MPQLYYSLTQICMISHAIIFLKTTFQTYIIFYDLLYNLLVKTTSHTLWFYRKRLVIYLGCKKTTCYTKKITTCHTILTKWHVILLNCINDVSNILFYGTWFVILYVLTKRLVVQIKTTCYIILSKWLVKHLYYFLRLVIMWFFKNNISDMHITFYGMSYVIYVKTTCHT